jgi:hypothetical protein
MEHKIEQCMVQLASVDCSVFTNDQQKLAYASQFLDMIHERFAMYVYQILSCS